jgi:hypothetical protein
MLTASEMTRATTPTTKIAVNELPASRNGLLRSALSAASRSAASSMLEPSEPTIPMPLPTGKACPAVVPSGSCE